MIGPDRARFHQLATQDWDGPAGRFGRLARKLESPMKFDGIDLIIIGHPKWGHDLRSV